MSAATDALRTAGPGVAARGLRGARPRRHDDGDDAGTVTAELALGLVSIVLVLGLLLGVVATASAQLRCLDAARSAARVAALGESDSVVAEVARTVAGRGAGVSVRREAPWVVVTVTGASPAGWDGLPTPSGTATAWVEP